MIAATLPSELTVAVTTSVVAFGAVIIFAGSIGSLRAGTHAVRLLTTYIGLGLELFLAAGLIRLANVETFQMLALAAAIITVRRVVSLGLGSAARTAG